MRQHPSCGDSAPSVSTYLLTNVSIFVCFKKKNAAESALVDVLVGPYSLTFLGYILRSRIPGSQSVSVFYQLRN